MFLNCSVVEFGGEGVDPKSKLKIAPEVLGAEVVVAVLQYGLNVENTASKGYLTLFRWRWLVS